MLWIVTYSSLLPHISSGPLRRGAKVGQLSSNHYDFFSICHNQDHPDSDPNKLQWHKDWQQTLVSLMILVIRFE